MKKGEIFLQKMCIATKAPKIQNRKSSEEREMQSGRRNPAWSMRNARWIFKVKQRSNIALKWETKCQAVGK
jgi:hypothetical protein